MAKANCRAFTLSANSGLFRELITEVGISMPIDEASVSTDDPRVQNFKALWDTGATSSVIKLKVAEALGAKPSGVVMIKHAGGEGLFDTYLLDFFLMNNIHFKGVNASICSDVVGDFDAIIGMDIISKGDFAFTNVGGVSVFSFMLPSQDKIDFVAEVEDCIKYTKIAAQWAAKGIHKCPCGSNKKFINCHGR